MTKKRWFRFYIDPWFKGTTGLSPNEIAAYITILCELYDNDGSAPLDMEVMPRRCGMRPSSFQTALDGLLKRKKLFLEAGILRSKPVENEIISREKLAQKSEESRKKLAEKDNEFRAKPKKDAPYTEYRNQKEEIATFQVSALPPASSSFGRRTSADSLAAFNERLARRGRAH